MENNYIKNFSLIHIYLKPFKPFLYFQKNLYTREQYFQNFHLFINMLKRRDLIISLYLLKIIEKIIFPLIVCI